MSHKTYNFDKILVVLLDIKVHDLIAGREALHTLLLHRLKVSVADGGNSIEV